MRTQLLLIGILIFILSGCASQTTKKHDPVFFPPAPNPPRVQFLLGIGNSFDVEGAETEYSLFSVGMVHDEKTKFFMKPYGIALSGDNIYVSDTIAAKVAILNLRQKSFNWLKGNFGPGKLKKPINLSTDNQGNLYVADTLRKLIVAYDPEGNFLRLYGQGLEMKPVDVAADDRHVYVLDLSRSQIVIFNKKDGKLIETLGQGNENPRENLSLPINMALNQQGVFYVTNFYSGQVIQLDRDGHVLSAIGKFGQGFGQFGRPRGIAVDAQGRMYVADAQHHNVQLFDDNNRLLMFFGDPGLPVGSLNLPAGIAVSDENLEFYQSLADPDFKLEQVVFVVSQAGPHRVAIYGLGKQRGVDYDAYYREVREMQKKIKASQKKKKQPE